MKSDTKRRAPIVYASAKFYDDAPKQIGSMACIECYETVFRVVKLNWGAEDDYERNKEGEVELNWTIQGEALERLKKICNNAQSPEAVVNYLKERFASHGRMAHHELLQWLEKKEIPYLFLEY